jgi:hypothetical protein
MEEPPAPAAPGEALQEAIGPAIEGCASPPALDLMAIDVDEASELEDMSHHQLEVDDELSDPLAASEAAISEAGASMSIPAYG